MVALHRCMDSREEAEILKTPLRRAFHRIELTKYIVCKGFMDDRRRFTLSHFAFPWFVLADYKTPGEKILSFEKNWAKRTMQK